ncbi:MAG: type VI secretion system baseplate subunit TssG [Thiohalocapsa sp.]|jgi:type VI secretion system protein ImpH
MASDHRPATDDLALLGALERQPWRFGFLQTLRRLECLYADRPRVGESARPADEPMRFGQEPSMIFAPAELAALHRSAAGRPPRLLVYFLGLLGPHGPLPLHLTDYARDRLRNAKDPTFARFLDLFNHRMLSLFYRAWAQAQPAVSFDRPAQDRFGTYLGSLQGIGMPAFRERDAMPDRLKLRFTGHLSCQTRHPEGLCAILGEFLRLPVTIEELIGHWLQLPAECCWRLGQSPDTGSLGQTITLGGRVWDHQSRFRVRIGPLCLADYLRLLPGGRSLRAVKAIVRDYVGDALEWDLNLVLSRAEVPVVRLGEAGRLGWTTWLVSRPLNRDGDDLKLDPERSPTPI